MLIALMAYKCLQEPRFPVVVRGDAVAGTTNANSLKAEKSALKQFNYWQKERVKTGAFPAALDLVDLAAENRPEAIRRLEMFCLEVRLSFVA